MVLGDEIALFYKRNKPCFLIWRWAILSWVVINIMPLAWADAKYNHCGHRKFLEIVAKSKKALSMRPYSIYFYESRGMAVDGGLSGFVLTDGKLFVDTRGGDLYPSKFSFDGVSGGFKLEKIVYSAFVDKTAILIPKYNKSCTELESVLLRTEYDQFGNSIPVKVEEFTRVKKCHARINDSSYGWINCQ